MNVPIIFIHYKDSYYLKYSLQSAVLFNPDKQVILLGDASNAHYTSLGIEHHSFNSFSSGPEIDLFDQVYQFIAGEQHSREEWTRFVFRRWFHIYNFIVSRGIRCFWTFDSDTLVLTKLSLQEEKFRGYDCTEQCSGICMNGFITNNKVVKGYLDKINELFRRIPFVDRQKESLKYFPKYAYTEMKAYEVYREETGIKRTRLSAIHNNETFLDSVCTLEEHRLYFNDDEYEVYEEKCWGFHLKKLYLCSDGNIFLCHRRSAQLVKLNSINMSWTPEWFFAALFDHARRKLPNKLLTRSFRKYRISLFDIQQFAEKNKKHMDTSR